MRVVLDTNVLMSGIFFSGPPYEILNAWRDQRVGLVVSADILDEYRRVGQRLSLKHPGEFVVAPELTEIVCNDRTDDKFFACAIASGCTIIVSGDKHLHRATGYGGVAVLSPRSFVEKYVAQ